MGSEGNSEMIGGDTPSELSANRTAMSLQRTGMSADRTLMSIIRTALSLISFGFTIYAAFSALAEKMGPHGIPRQAPMRFGAALIFLGVLLLILGLWNHWNDTRLLRDRRRRLFELGIMHHTAEVKVSTVTVVALLLLLIGLAAIALVVFSVGPLA